jgi:DNA-binding transcriptional regulator YhcF (GntR family)
MHLNLDHDSPIPLYHQLAEAIRYRVATGELKAGAVLPPLRHAAKLWGVNLHTVRRAYAELARIHVASTRAPHGTRILAAASAPRSRSPVAAREEFVRSIVAEARRRHGLEVDELVGLIRNAQPRETGEPASVSVVECSRTQCEDLASQLEARWRVRATPWVLSDGEPPPGAIVATYFHYNDVRQSWPARAADARFLAIAPEPDLATRLSRTVGRRGRRVTAVLCEREESMARNISADLVRLLPGARFRVETKVVRRAEDALRRLGRSTAILLSPRMWGELSDDARSDPRVTQVRYVFDPAELDALGSVQGWESR